MTRWIKATIYERQGWERGRTGIGRKGTRDEVRGGEYPVFVCLNSSNLLKGIQGQTASQSEIPS